MIQVGIHEAKTHLSRLLERVQGGEEVIIAKSGKPIARIQPMNPPIKKRILGLDQNRKFYIADDFDEIPAEFKEYIK